MLVFTAVSPLLFLSSFFFFFGETTYVWQQIGGHLFFVNIIIDVKGKWKLILFLVHLNSSYSFTDQKKKIRPIPNGLIQKLVSFYRFGGSFGFWIRLFLDPSVD